jgi:uncharacterized membrane protein (GlpM family)
MEMEIKQVNNERETTKNEKVFVKLFSLNREVSNLNKFKEVVRSGEINSDYKNNKEEDSTPLRDISFGFLVGNAAAFAIGVLSSSPQIIIASIQPAMLTFALYGLNRVAKRSWSSTETAMGIIGGNAITFIASVLIGSSLGVEAISIAYGCAIVYASISHLINQTRIKANRDKGRL